MSESVSYVNLLKQKVVSRMAADPKLSIRKLAREIGITPSMFSMVLNGKRNLSLESAFRITHCFDFTDSEQEQFRRLVRYALSKSPDEKTDLLKGLKDAKEEQSAYTLEVNRFKTISEWYPVALLAWIQSKKNMGTTVSEASRVVGLSELVAETTLERLIALGLVQKDQSGIYTTTNRRVEIRCLDQNKALRQFHGQILGKLSEALITQTPKEKYIASETIAFDKSLSEIEAEAEAFLKRVTAIAKSGTSRNAVYTATVGFFRISEKEHK